MEFGAVHEGTGATARLSEAIEAPLAIFDPGFEEHAIGGAVFLKVEEALFGLAVGVGLEDDFPSELSGTGERVDIEEEGIVDAVKLNGLADGGFDDLGMALDFDRVFAQFVEAVEDPELVGSEGGEGGED